MLTERSREISHHAIVGASIAGFLALVEVLGRSVEDWLWFSTIIQCHPWIGALRWLVPPGIGFLVFFFVRDVISWYDKHEGRKPIEISGLGIVDGRWLNAVIQEGRVVGISELLISSSQNDGFTVKGTTYIVQNDEPMSAEHGTFHGTGGKVFAGNVLGYIFEGTLGQDKRRVSGIAYYQFDLKREGKMMFLEGAFLDRATNSMREACGRSIVESEVGELPSCDVESAKKDWIKCEKVEKARRKSEDRLKKDTSPAGSHDSQPKTS